MTDTKKFLIISLISNLVYVVLGVILMLVNKLNTVSVVLCAAIILVSVVSSVLTWKIMHDQNNGNK